MRGMYTSNLRQELKTCNACAITPEISKEPYLSPHTSHSTKVWRLSLTSQAVGLDSSSFSHVLLPDIPAAFMKGDGPVILGQSDDSFTSK